MNDDNVACREITLDELVATCPPGHRARTEYDALREQLARARDAWERFANRHGLRSPTRSADVRECAAAMDAALAAPPDATTAREDRAIWTTAMDAAAAEHAARLAAEGRIARAAVAACDAARAENADDHDAAMQAWATLSGELGCMGLDAPPERAAVGGAS